MRLMVRFGQACKRFMDQELHDLNMEHVECDEIWTFVQKKQGRLTVDEKRDRHDIGDIYTFTALDRESKLIAAVVVGKRSADNTRRFMRQLAGRMRMPKPHESDRDAYKVGSYPYITRISTDEFAAYPEAVDLAFGPYAKFGTIRKDYRNADQPGRYAPPEMIGSRRRGVFGIREDEIRGIGTSHVERNNLTIRTLMKRFTRLSLGFSKKLENLAAAVAMFVCYYNWVWRTRYPDHSGQAGRLRPTPAMMAGVTDRRWSFPELFDAVMAIA